MAYRIIHHHISDDVVETIEALLDGAKNGLITGLAFACIMKRMRYFTDVTGQCQTHPTFSRGIVMELSDELGHMADHSDPSDTR